MGRNPYVLFGLVALASLVSSMQLSMVAVALPDLIRDLHAPLRWVGWVITMYTLAQVVSLPIAGKLSDDLGRRTVFVGGLAMFTVASAVAAVAPNVYVLILARGVQGFGGGTLTPSAYGIVSDAFGERRTRPIGLIASINPIGSIVGPTVGGLIVDTLGWRWTFALNAPLGAAVVVAALVLMSGPGPRTRRRIDVRGALLLTTALVPFIYALTELSQKTGRNGLVVAACLVVAGLATAAFLRQEARESEPIVDLTLVRRREFASVNALVFLYGVSYFAFFPLIPLFAESAYGLSAGQSGLLLTPRAVVTTLVSAATSVALLRLGCRRPIVVGFAIMALAMLILSFEVHRPVAFGVTLSNPVYLSCVVALAGAGLGIAGPASNNAAIDLLPERVGVVSGMRGMFIALGGTIGTAMVVLITSQSSTVASGLEMTFAGLAALTLLSTLLVFGIPDRTVAPIAESAPSTALHRP